MTKRVAQLSAIAVIALIAFVLVLVFRPPGEDRFAECTGSRIAGGNGLIGGSFELTNQFGQVVTDRDVIIKPSLIYFGYTFCPDVCPLDTARNAEAVDLLDAVGFDVTPVFISIDPERDTPEVLADYVAYTHEKMIGLTGTPQQVKAVSKAFKTFYRKAGEGPDYLMDHSTFTYLMLPDFGFADFFRRDLSPSDLADRVACFARAM